MMLYILWDKFKGWVISAAALVALFVTVYLKGRSDQKETNQNKVFKERLESVTKAREVSDEVRKMSPSDVDRGLDRFMRD